MILKTNIREIDLICRYGGEEFIILLPNTNTDAATVSAKRIIDKTKNIFIDTHIQTITTSIGISQLNSKDIGLESIIKRADIALYEAKNNGRNQFKINF